MKTAILRRARAGVTLVELMIVSAILTLVITATYQVILTTMSLSAHSGAWADVLEWSQHGINDVSQEVASLRKIFGNDAVGNAYLAALQPPVAFPRETNLTLPTPSANGTFCMDVAGAVKTGNCLLIAKERAPFNCLLGSGQTRRIDCYTLLLFYLSPVNRRMGNFARSLRVARWESVEFADRSQVMSLSGPEQVEVAKKAFAQRGITYLWQIDASPATAFYNISGLGNPPDLTALAPNALYRPATGSNTNLIGNLGLGFAGVAWNRDNLNWVSEQVPRFAIANAGGDGFPNGFEVQIIGPTGARTIFMRLVIMMTAGVDLDLDTFEVTSIVNAREF